MNAPLCPIHNVEMTLKTARRGKNAGGQFWGCPTWAKTKCKQAFDYEEESSQGSEMKNIANYYIGVVKRHQQVPN